jgi:hypothetical protein
MSPPTKEATISEVVVAHFGSGAVWLIIVIEESRRTILRVSICLNGSISIIRENRFDRKMRIVHAIAGA